MFLTEEEKFLVASGDIYACADPGGTGLSARSVVSEVHLVLL
jgi:hypothetical protein